MTRESWIFHAGTINGGACVLIGLAISELNVTVAAIGMGLWFGSYLIDPRNPHSYTAKRFPK